MKSARNHLRVLLILVVLAGVCPVEAQRMAENFDVGWLFLKSDAPGAEQSSFADQAWRRVNLPHDWSIEGPFAATNRTGGSGGFLPSGVGWYRKHFMLPKSDGGRCVFIEFDGVMQNSDVWINGFHLGHRPYGYSSFSYDLTGHVILGADNIIAVRCDTSEQPASRWYSGAGIYRHVRLMETGPIHFAEHGIFISTPDVTKDEATVRVESTIVSPTAEKITLQTTIIAPGGRPVATLEMQSSLAAGKIQILKPQIEFSNPRLWNLDDPALYRVVSTIISNGNTLDLVTNTFGIRNARFEAATGFWLNGRNIKIKGVCLHHDGGAFGAAVPLSIWESRLKTLKSLGANAVRTAHNPPAPEFLDLCDRMGFLVMDEMFDCWTVPKDTLNRQTLADYHLYFNDWSKKDEHDAIARDRNHPCVIIYSVGNEIHDTRDANKAKRILNGLIAVAHETDPTRPVTQALFRPNVTGDYTNGLADLLDVVGQNYREKEILAAHEQNPARKILGTENTHTREQWVAVRDHAPYAGQFLWTGVDYLGEAKNWPAVGHGSGLLDRTGMIRPFAEERKSWWTDTPMVTVTRRVAATEAMPSDPGYGAEEKHTQVVFADWTPKNTAPHTENVEVYSNCKEVELFLNGKSQGIKAINKDASARTWAVPFEPGTLKAIARNDGVVVATDELRTAGEPAKIVLSSNIEHLSAGWDNVAVVRATITDVNGVEIPHATDLVSFSISGPGEIAAVDNGDNTSHESFQATSRHAYLGQCVGYVRATEHGAITVTASAPALTSGTITLAP